MTHETTRAVWWVRVGARVSIVGLLVFAGATLAYTQSRAQAQYSYYLPLLILSRPIAFESDRDGNYNHDLYLMNTDGTNVVRVIGPDAVSCPSWSPDGRSLLYESVLTRHIYAINSDGTGLTQLTTGSRSEYCPVWSPDGKYIAFSATDSNSSGIYVIQPGQMGETTLISSRLPDDYWTPQWSPDGRRLAFGSDFENNIDIYVADVITTTGSIRLSEKLVRLTNDVWDDSFPSWSPDGERIAFMSGRDGDLEIWTMRADGTQASQITDNRVSDSNPVWSPDGTQILFTSERDGSVDVYVMNADGSNQVNLTNSPFWEGAATWLP